MYYIIPIKLFVGEDLNSNKVVENIQNDGLELTSETQKDAEKSETSNASVKVKVTHLELPFGKADSDSAEEALKVMKKIPKTDKMLNF